MPIIIQHDKREDTQLLFDIIQLNCVKVMKGRHIRQFSHSFVEILPRILKKFFFFFLTKLIKYFSRPMAFLLSR